MIKKNMLKIQQMEKNMKKYFNAIRKCALFEEVSDENLLAMLGCLGAKVIEIEKNQPIIKEGDVAKYVGIVLSGEVQLVRNDFYGNRSIVTNVETSQLFGESFACADEKYMPVDVIASEKTEVMLIDCRRITNSCSNACSFHRQMIFNLLKVVAKKNIVFHQKIEITSKRTTREKLMTYLLHQAKKNNSNSFTIPFDRQALADYLEVDRSGLSVEIGKLQKEGVIVSKRNYFELLT